MIRSSVSVIHADSGLGRDLNPDNKNYDYPNERGRRLLRNLKFKYSWWLATFLFFIGETISGINVDSAENRVFLGWCEQN